MCEPSHGKPTETEVTLVVVSDAPEGVALDVARLRELGPFDLRPRQHEMIHDRYFDTPNAALRRARSALRVREIGPRRLLTLKGPARPGRKVGRTRDEQEEAWPEGAWTLLRTELGELLPIPEAPPSPDPVEALLRSGFILVQDRETSRRVRAVVPAGEDLAVAELAVDTVTFHLPTADVCHHEIEIEAKAPGADDALAALADGLLTRLGPSLRPWGFGKLATGMAVGELIDERGPERVLAGDGSLRPSAYDAIASLLTPAAPATAG